MTIVFPWVCSYYLLLVRKSTIYEMSWPKGLIEIGSSLVAIAPYGGPIGKNAFTIDHPVYCLIVDSI